MKKYRIFIDTNPIWNDKGPLSTVFAGSLSELVKFVRTHRTSGNISVCLPDIVIRERVKHKKEQIESNIKHANERIVALREAGHDEPELIIKDDYDVILRKFADDFCKTNDIEIISAPMISIEDLINLAIEKRRPFDDHGSGFKDTLIYYSMIEDAKSAKGDVYMLCTNNTNQFTEELVVDFKEKTGKELIILTDIVSVQQKLDELLPLGLHLEEMNNRVKNLVLNHTGELMVVANKNLNNNSILLGGWAAHDLSAFRNRANFRFGNSSLYDTASEDEDPVGCNLNDLEFLTIEKISDDEVRVQARLNVELKYPEKNEGSSPFEINTDFALNRYLYRPVRQTNKSFDFTMDCNLEKGLVNIRNWS